MELSGRVRHWGKATYVGPVSVVDSVLCLRSHPENYCVFPLWSSLMSSSVLSYLWLLMEDMSVLNKSQSPGVAIGKDFRIRRVPLPFQTCLCGFCLQSTIIASFLWGTVSSSGKMRMPWKHNWVYLAPAEDANPKKSRTLEVDAILFQTSDFQSRNASSKRLFFPKSWSQAP